MHLNGTRAAVVVTCIAILSIARATAAAVLVVDPVNGPYATVQAGLNAAVAGDTVHVKPGVYRERVSFPTGGTSDTNRVTLEGEPGAILDGSNSVTLNWILDTGIGAGVYRANVTGFTPFTVTANGKIIASVTEAKCDQTTEPYYWPTFFASGFPQYGWTGIKAVVMWHASSSELYIRFDGALNPNSMAMTVSPRAAVVTISGKNYITVRGMTLRNCANGIDVTTSLGTVIENCTIGPIEWGINLKTGTGSCKVRNNDLFYNPYFESDPFYEPTGAEAWDVIKKAGEYNRWGIRTEPGTLGGHEISDNFVHDQWDGINLESNASQTAGNDVHHNYVYKTFDNATKLSYVQSGTKFHDNIIEWGRRGLRISEISNGPLFIYRNFFLETKSGGLVPYTNNALAPAEMWGYQNTGCSDDGIYCDFAGYSGGQATTPNYHWYNNLFWCNRGQNKNVSYLPTWTGSDYDIYVRARTGDRPWTSEGNGWGDSAWNAGVTNTNGVPCDSHALWVTSTGAGPTFFLNSNLRDLGLSSSSQARTRGLDLTTLYGGALPGAAAGYFTGTQPDVGALQYGEPMPQLPRGLATELESASFTASDTTTVYSDVNASAGQYVALSSNAVNDYITYTIPVNVAGTYVVKVRGKTKTSRGICQLQVDGAAVSGSWDQYATTQNLVDYAFGAVALTTGSHTFKFLVTGKNAASTDYQLAFDSLVLAPYRDEIVMDNADASGVTITGTWTAANTSHGARGANYLHDGNASKGSLSVRYTPTIATSGNYQVFARWTKDPNRASNVPIDITYNGGSTTVTVNQQFDGGSWVSLGTYYFAAGTGGNVLIRNTGTNGYVIADGVKFARVIPPPSPINVEMVAVGNVGNADDTTATRYTYNGGSAGGVAYAYNVAKYEITVAQWTQFLNLADPTGINALNLWNASMQISNTAGNPSGQHYTAVAGKGNWACNYVSWSDAARFCNYLTSGSTEAGAYNMTTLAVDRAGAKATYGKCYAIATVDEWYKAAFNTGMTGADYRDVPFSGSVSTAKANYNATFTPNTICDVGTFSAWPGFYGTFDMGGNVAEWTEEPDPLASTKRLFLGGCCTRGSGDMAPSYIRQQYYYQDDSQIGVRIVQLP